MYGTQTYGIQLSSKATFENDVKMYGTQTLYTSNPALLKFENDVKMYGTQTDKLKLDRPYGLRMM